MTQLDALPYRMYLLAWDLRRDRLFDRTRTAFVIRAAVLAELALRGALSGAGHPAVTVPGAAGDPVLDQALAQAASQDRSWKALLRRGGRPTLDAVERQLELAGVIAIGPRRRLLGSGRHISLRDRAAARAAQQQFARVLADGAPAASSSDADAALVALAAAGGVRTVLSRRDRRGHAARVEATRDQLAIIAPGLADAVRGLPRTIVAAQGGMGGS